MKDKKILYFSLNRKHVTGFNKWAKTRKPVKWLKTGDPNPVLDDLSKVIDEQDNKDSLYVIIDYLSFIKGVSNDNENAEYKDIATYVHHTILQFPEVNFLFDQSGISDEWLSGIEFLLGDNSDSDSDSVAQGFHVFRKEDGFVLFDLDYDNIFDGSNLRWAVRNKYYSDLELENTEGNFEKLQTARKNNLAIVVDDEPRQSRFNSFALYASGYRVIQVCKARMLLTLNACIRDKLIKKEKEEERFLVLRDFDLQFPDASKRKDYDEETSTYKSTYKDVLIWGEGWKVNKKEKEIDVDLSCFEEKGEDPPRMIDSIRNYRFFSKKEYPWKDIYKVNIQSPFWGWTNNEDGKENAYSFVISNGHAMMNINDSKYHKWIVNEKHWLDVLGIEKPVSGLYYPFFTKLKDEEGKTIVKDHFLGTRYKIKEREKYRINKKRKAHNHGVPVDVYDAVNMMLQRAENYYQNGCYIKTAVLSQEAIELLNGFHYQMMIKAYRLKFIAENSISMDVVGADERQLVLDAEERIKIIKEEIHRIVYSQGEDEKHSKYANIYMQIRQKEKETELLDHIFNDCRDTCHKNEFFEVEAVFISAIAHVNDGYSFYSFGRDFAFLFHKTMHIIKDAYSDLICSINQKDKDDGQ